MRVIPAMAKGMCFGVRDALERVLGVENPNEVTIWGELVHNDEVLQILDARGFLQRGEDDRDGEPTTDRVLITAHGVSSAERERLARGGRELIDTTCPLVKRVHEVASDLEADGRRVIVLGRRGHVELRGVLEDLADPIVIEGETDVRDFDEPRIGVVVQTTMRVETMRALVAAIKRCNPKSDVLVVDTICDPTKQRILALDQLLPRVDAVVVVGGKRSNNTGELAHYCEHRGVRAIRVEDEHDLDAEDFRCCEIVGLTAGTSTLDDTIRRVQHALWLLESPSAAAASVTRARGRRA